MKIFTAAQLMEAVYADPGSADIEVSINIKGVQAYMTKDRVLVIPGTNEFSDWFQFNFDVFGRGRSDIQGFATATGDSGAVWHAGFLEHARLVYTFAKGLKPRQIIGHSLGAASAQIVGSSLKVPTIAFASPRTLRGDRGGVHGEGFVVNLCRSDDSVCHVPPPFMGFRHVGRTIWMNPRGINFWEDHRIDQYLEIMVLDEIAAELPTVWPDEPLRRVA